jgi:hypothetical protein
MKKVPGKLKYYAFVDPFLILFVMKYLTYQSIAGTFPFVNRGNWLKLAFFRVFPPKLRGYHLKKGR